MRDDTVYLCWSDLAHALYERWSLMRLTACVFAGAFLLFALFRAPIFVSEAMFQVKGKQAVAPGSVGGIIQLAAGATPNQGVEQTLAMLESRRVGESVIRATGLQMRPGPEGKSLRLLKNFKDNLIGEFAWWTDRPSSAAKTRDHPWKFSHVTYQGLYPKAFSITIESDRSYTVETHGGKFAGHLGEFFCYDGLRFILEVDDAALAGSRWELVAEPMFKAYDRYKRNVYAQAGKRKNGIIMINYAHLSPRLSMAVTNALMSEYLRLAKVDAKRVTDEQMRFLASAQEDAWVDLSSQYDAYLDVTQESVQKNGFIRTKDALTMFTKNYGETMCQLNELERELVLLQSADPILMTTVHHPVQKQLFDYNQQLQVLNTRKNSLEFALQNSGALGEEVHAHLKAQEKERQKRLDLISRFQAGADQHYIQSLIASCNLRRRIHETKMAAAALPPNEMQGLGLGAATENYESNLAVMRNLENQSSALDRAIEQLASVDFDTGALIDTLAVGADFQQKVRECHALNLALKDAGNYSTKERARIQEELGLKRAALKKHLQSVRAVNEGQQVDRRAWIQKAQLGLLGLVFKEIALVEEEIRRVIERRRTDLEGEIHSHRATLAKIRQDMAGMPQAWLRERKLDLQTKFQTEMMHALVGLVESRQLAASLDIVESKPLDAATFPIRPQAPYLVFWTIAGSIFGLVLSGVYSLASAVRAGFPVSRNNLLARDQFVAGLTSKSWEKAFFYTHQKIVYCTGLDSEDFFRLVALAKEQGEVVKTAARHCDLEGCDIELKRLHREEVQASIGEGIDRLFVYVSKGPLSPQTLSMISANGDWIVGLRGERVKDLAPYFDISHKARVAFLLSHCP